MNKGDEVTIVIVEQINQYRYKVRDVTTDELGMLYVKGRLKVIKDN